jgi:hypothetical protein
MKVLFIVLLALNICYAARNATALKSEPAVEEDFEVGVTVSSSINWANRDLVLSRLIDYLNAAPAENDFILKKPQTKLT